MFALAAFAIYLSKAIAQAAPISGSTSKTQFDSSFCHWERALPNTPCDCSNSGNQRSLWDIIWSCLSVVFACTWVAVHPNMADPKEGQWKVSVRRLKLMVWCLLAPEFMIMWAMKQWMGARKISKFYKDRGWTMTHGFFLQMGGFRLYEGNKPHSLLWFDYLRKLDEEHWVEFPNITASEIEDRSKGDGLSKAFVILQTTWFIVQCIARKAQKLPITELELVALAFATLNGVIYVFWWYKPLNIRFPVHVQLKVPVNMEFTVRAVEHVSEAPDSDFAQPEDALSESPVHDVPPLMEKRKSLEEENSHSNPSDNSPQQNLTESGLEHPKPIRSSVSLDPRKSPFSWSTITWNEFVILSFHFSARIRHDIRQLWKNTLQFWEATGDMGIFRSVNCMIGAISAHPNKDMQKMPTYYALPVVDSEISHVWTVSSFAAMLFGAIHCCAWMSSFATPIEKKLWRFGSATIVGVPFQVFLISIPVLILRRADASRISWADIIGSISVLVGFTLYICARLILFVEAFITLRALPSATYDTVIWTDFIPHI